MTMTMAETFDAPMTDSGDIDVSMYPGMTTVDPWLSVEASMGDDLYQADAATLNYVQEGVEIEMDDDDEPMTEYEMADEGSTYYDQDLQDVEVYDISQAASPRLVEDHSLIAQTHTEYADPMHIPSSDGPAQEFSGLTHETAPSLDASEMRSEVEHTPIVVHAAQVSVAEHDSFAPQPTVTTPQAVVEVLETTLADGVSASVDGGASTVDISSTTSAHLEVSQATPYDAVPQESSAASTSGLDLTTPATNVDHPKDGDHQKEDLAHTEENDTGVDVPNEAVSTAPVEANDPHEISEGVYIDPPPPVLLSLPPSAEYGECSLFNLPSSSQPYSPSSSARPRTGNALHLLLHDRPTLYYEPLSAVFLALRQEQFIQNMPGFSEVELILDAYDLQLSVSEDNVYTHEVTLHELNVIHDGSDLNGPLRLRLKVFAPRFVTRYNMLRDQISRLSVTAEGEEARANIGTTDSQTDQEITNHDAASETEGEEQYHYPDNGVEQPEESTEQCVNHPDEKPNSEGIVSSQRGSSGLNATEVLGQQQAPAGAEVEAQVEEATVYDEGEESAEEGAGVEGGVHLFTVDAGEGFIATEKRAKIEENEDTLHTDEISEPVAEEGGDYVDYADFIDEEEELGEELVEGFGGESKDEAYSHTGARDDQQPFPEDGNEDEYERDESNAIVIKEQEEHVEDYGFAPAPNTDVTTHSHSEDASDGDREDQRLLASNAQVQDDTLTSYDAVTVVRPENFALTQEADEDDLFDNWDDDGDLEAFSEKAGEDLDDALSRKSSTTTLASRTSKRAYDEVDLHEFDDYDVATSSPDAKRPRTE